MKKLSELGYPEFMQECMERLKNFDGNICDSCGGTGLIPVMCCTGRDCGCHGLPVDMETKCPECGRIAG